LTRNAVDEWQNVRWRGDGYRLIPSRFPPVAIYEDVVSADRLEALVAVENLTNPRLQSAERLMGLSLGLSPDSPRLQNWNHAPFAYSNPEGSRFFPPERPCLELCDSRQTGLAVSVADHVRQCGVISDVSPGRHRQAALGVICS
jgi:hypothetical protein